MLLESLEEGELRWNMDLITEGGEMDEFWCPVGTVIGEIIDDENDGEVVEEWTWQAYLDED